LAFNVTVKVDDLMAKIQDNRDKHRAVFEDALAGFKDAAVKALNERVEKIRTGKRGVNLYVSLAEPSDHTRDYDRVIGMLEMHKAAGNDTITLAESDAARYVNDDWEWKRQWARLSNSYASKSYASKYGEYNEDSE